jgi:hypothetical protein
MGSIATRHSLTFTPGGRAGIGPAPPPCCCLVRSAREPGRRRQGCSQENWTPVCLRGHARADARPCPRRSGLPGCGNFIRGPRSNAMIRHPIRAAARTAVSRTARRRRRIGKQGLSNAAPRRHVAVCGRNSIVRGRHRPTPDHMPGDPRGSGSGPPMVRINHMVTKP